jgi:hypothetical protein
MQANSYINGWPYQDAELKHQISGSDRTHRLAVTGQYELPFGKGKPLLAHTGKLVDRIAGGWISSWIFTKYTGTPVGLNTGYRYICAHGFAPDGGPTLQNYFYALGAAPGACYSRLSTYDLYTGTNRTDSARNPVIPNLDLALMKNFPVRERLRMQFRAEAFNLTNSVLFGGPDTNPGDVVRVSSTGVWSGFGTVGITQQNFPRIVQLSLKAMF